MIYERRLQTLIVTLRSVLPTIKIDAHDAERSQQILSLLDDCEQWLRHGELTPKKAFFTILRQIAIVLSYKEKPDMQFRQTLKDALFDLDANGQVIDIPLLAPNASAQSAARHLLVDGMEFLFVFLYENARLALSASGLAALNTLVEEMLESGDENLETLRETNWNIALLLFQEYSNEKAGKNKEYLAKILFGCLTNKINDAEIRKEIEDMEAYIAPLTLHDFLFYKMTQNVVPPNLHDHLFVKTTQKNIHDTPSFGDPFFEELIKLMRERHTIKNKDFLPKTYDQMYMGYCQHFIFAMNAYYQAPENEAEQDKLKRFVGNIRKFDGLVRSLQARVVALNETLQASNPSEKYIQIQRLKRNIDLKREELNKNAKSLTDYAAKILDQGLPSSKWRLVLGIGLLIIGAGLLLAGITSLLAIAPCAGIVATVAAFFSAGATELSWAAIAMGSVSLVGGSVSFFKGLPTSPKSVTTTAATLIKVCQDAGLAACEKIENTNVLGMNFGLK
jgi:hypothetical protein